MKNNKKAFTLAEVLVTMGIIGVVAALTVPNLIKNYQTQSLVTSLHKVYNEFSQAFERYLSDQRVETLTESDLGGGNANGIRTFMTDYFKIVNNCNGKYNYGSKTCFAESYGYVDSEGSTTIASTCNGTYTLASGAAICVDAFNNSNYVALIEVDVNGAQGPNIFGRDFFQMYVKPDGTLYDQKWLDNNQKANFAKNNGSATGAFGQILNDNWQMNY